MATSSSISNAQIWEALGSLRASHDAMRDEVRREAVHAALTREKTFDRLETYGRRLDSVEANIADMKPAIAGLTTLRTKAVGMILALGIVGAILGAFLTYFKDVLFRSFGWP